MSEQKLIIMIGLPGSGKSTYVDKTLVPLGYQVVCADDLRKAHGHAFFGPLEPQIHGTLYTQARALMFRGLNIVIDECTVRASYLARWIRLAQDMEYDVEVHAVDTPLPLCVERRKLQDPMFPLDVITQKANTLNEEWLRIEKLLEEHNCPMHRVPWEAE